MEDLNDMLYFAEVAERGGFAAAGRALGLPKSRLSRRVAELESRLGVRLLQRTTRKLSLTEVGDIYLRHCSAMRDEALAAAEAVAHLQVEPRGMLRVTCPVTLAQSTLGYLIPRYLALFPLVKLDLRVTNRVVDLVEEGIDIALRVRPTLDDSGSLVVKQLGATCGHLLASPEQLRRQGMPATPAKTCSGWTRWPCHRPTGAAPGRWSGRKGRSSCFSTSRVMWPTTCRRSSWRCWPAPASVFCPTALSQAELQAQLLVPVLPGWAPKPGMAHAVFPSRRGQIPAVRSFLDFLGKHMQGDEVLEMHRRLHHEPVFMRNRLFCAIWQYA